MTGDKELFSELEEKYLKMHIEMDDDNKYSATRVGTITFLEGACGSTHLEECYACTRTDEELGIRFHA